MTTRILMLCLGNICRSPMAAVVLRRALAERGLTATVDSAGVSAEERGNPMDPRAIRVLREHGYEVGDHVARKIHPSELSDVDLVVGMEQRHLDALRNVRHDAELHLLTDFIAGAKPGTPVIDPWYGNQEGFTTTLRQLEAANEGLCAWVASRT